MRFASPYYLLLLAFVYLIIDNFRKRMQGKKASIKFSTLGVVKKAIRPGMVRFRHILLALRIGVVVLLILALARPQSGKKFEEILTRGIDIILTLDTSGSMKAEDFKPLNRLHVAKENAARFIRGRKNDRIGLVVFSASSFTQCPLTTDYGILLEFLKNVKIGMIQDGTAIGTAIASSVNRLRKSDAKSRVIILLTDGQNNMGKIEPLTAAKIAKKLGVKIYTIGIGKPGSALYPVEDPIFGKRYVRIPTEIDEDCLREIAEMTGGQYFRATDADALTKIYEKIDQLEKVEIKTKQYMVYTELFPWFLGAALILLLTEIVLANTKFRIIP